MHQSHWTLFNAKLEVGVYILGMTWREIHKFLHFSKEVLKRCEHCKAEDWLWFNHIKAIVWKCMLRVKECFNSLQRNRLHWNRMHGRRWRAICLTFNDPNCRRLNWKPSKILSIVFGFHFTPNIFHFRHSQNSITNQQYFSQRASIEKENWTVAYQNFGAVCFSDLASDLAYWMKP